MKVTTDACLFGAWTAEKVKGEMLEVKTVLDIGTGTGLLSLMLAQKVNASIDAIEMDKDAFEQAKENIAAAPEKDRINIHYADVREFLFPSHYDIILSNPPFYENELRSPDAKKNTAHHEGLALNELLEIIKKNLSPAGRFYLLLPYKRNSEIDKLVDSTGLSITQKSLVRQSVNHDHFRIMIEGEHTKEKKEMIIDEISIRDDKGQYTDKFIDLLKDYYLYL